MEKLIFDIIHTPWGFAAVSLSRLGLRHLVLPRTTKQAAFDALCEQTLGEELIPDNKNLVLKKIGVQLKSYFQGQFVAFTYKLDYNLATPFQRQVWSVTRTIQYGTTRTYGWIAERLGDPDAKRAVGQALHANPLPLLVPCHRVTAAHGKLGGFSSGTELKSRLLQLEGVILT